MFATVLENREMTLEDGRLMLAADRYDELAAQYPPEELARRRLLRVSEDFRVIALGLPVPTFVGRALDPPYTAALHRLFTLFSATGTPKVSFSISFSIWSASSRVGASTSPLGQTAPLPSSAPPSSRRPPSSSRCSIGSRNASVLPLPVCAMHTRSAPASASGRECDCTGVGAA